MKKIVLALGLSMFAISLYAADAAKEPTAQQNKMKVCSEKAKGLKGDEYKKTRDECLKAQPAAAAEPEGKKLTAQQQKMKDCMAKAKGLKGDEFKKTRDDCMKAK
jgi:psiF repeat